MKAIINGKKYDTETAEPIGEDSSDVGSSDFNYFSETLYRKKTGEFFLYGEGGAMSRYSRNCGQNSSCGGSKTIPLSLEEAKEWCERVLSVKKYEEIFGEISE
jgi:hypothetical protein